MESIALALGAKGGENVLDRIRNFNSERSDLDEMVELLVIGEEILGGYEKNSLEAPEWLKDNVGVLRKEIAARRRDNLERALKLAEGRLETLKSAEEKRQDTAAEITRLRAALGGNGQ